MIFLKVLLERFESDWILSSSDRRVSVSNDWWVKFSPAGDFVEEIPAHNSFHICWRVQSSGSC